VKSKYIHRQGQYLIYSDTYQEARPWLFPQFKLLRFLKKIQWCKG